MICKDCGARMQWRCTNLKTKMAKYKCPHCGLVEIVEDDWKPVESRKPKHYYLKQGRYIVRRWMDGKYTHIGSYVDEETAKKVVDKMIEYDWDKSMVPQAHKELGIDRVKGTWVMA